MAQSRSTIAITVLAAVGGLIACSQRVEDTAEARSARTRPPVDTEVAVWSLSLDPTLEIGVVHGDPDYELDRAISSVQLADGRIVVSNGGSNELRFYDAAGRFLNKAGGRGGGPGEFQWLSRIYRYGPDSILVLDFGPNRLSVFDTDGKYARQAAASLVSGDTVFPLDTWLFRRFWVDGAMEPSIRGSVKRVLEPMRVSDPELPYRFVRVSDEGDLWIREPLADRDAESWQWTVFDSTGRSAALVQTPLQFDIHEIGSDYVLGRWRDADGVNFIRMYALRVSDARGRIPDWITSPSDELPQLSPEEADRLLVLMRSSLTQVVLAQESYYVGHGSYTENRHLLEWTHPENIRLDIITADRVGWAAVATHRLLGRICGMAVGTGTPPGWPEGIARCG